MLQLFPWYGDHRPCPLLHNRPLVPDSVDQQSSVSALQMAPGVVPFLEQNQGSALEPPDPPRVTSQSFFLGYKHGAATEGLI